MAGHDARHGRRGRRGGVRRGRPAARRWYRPAHAHRRVSRPVAGPVACWIKAGAGRLFVDVASTRSGTFVMVLALAHLMSPPGLGAFGVVVVALLGAQSIGQLGMGRALYLWRPAPESIAPTVTTLSVASSAAVYAVCYSVAPLLATGMSTPAAVPMIRTATLSVLISGLVTAPRAILQRRAPSLRMMIEQADNWIGVAVTIGLAATGHGLMSLAVGRIAGSIVSAALFIVFSPGTMRIGFHRGAARMLLRTAPPFAASGLLAFAISNVDQIVVGHVAHARGLGYYLLALSLASWPVTVISQPIRDAATVAFARFRRGPRIAGSAFASSVNLLAALTLPTCVLIGSSAAALVQLLYGSRWAPAAHVLPWLVLLATLRVFYALANDYFSVLVSSRRKLAFQLTWLGALLPVLAVAASRGILAIAVVQVIIAAALLVPWYLSRRKIFASWPRMAGTGFAAPVAATAGVLLVAVGTHLLDPDLVTELAVAACTASAALVLMIIRLRPVYLAVRQGGTGAAQAGRIADVIGPALAVVLEAPFYPVAELLSPRVPRLGPPSAARDLGSRIRSGAKWSVLNSLLVRIGNFVVGMVLARTVFGPSVWGLYAISQLVLALLLSANELGVSAAIIRWEGDMRSFARTVYTLSLITSAMMYAVLYLTAPGIARMLGSPGATPMLRVLCICVVLDALCAVPLALLTREFAQGRRMVVDVLNFAADNLVTLWLAFTGWGVMSFAWGALAGCAVALIAATAAAPYVVLPGWNTAQARQLLRFGLPLAWASLFGLGVLNVDSAIVGAVLGPAMLGLYQLAFNISSWPATTISLAVQRVSFAGFSRVADTADGLEATFIQALRLLLALTVPACVLLATLAAPLIHIVYGDRWAAAAHALSLLAVLGLMRVVYGLFYNCIAAAGRRTLLMGIQGLWLAALIPVLIAGALLRGITGVSAGHVIVAAGLIGPAFLWGLSRTGIRIRSVAAVCVRPLIGGAAMVVASLLAVRLAGSGLTGLALAAAGGVGIYLPFVYPLLALLRPSSPVSHERPEAAVP